jgi:bifunctional oligoribonuclease and PAP phosphatase NrnA
MSVHYPEYSPRFARMLLELKGRRVAVIGHARPDGDCIGSQVAMARILRAQGNEIVCLNGDVVPRRLQFLVGDMTFLRAAEFDPQGWDAVFVDCADQARVGDKFKVMFPRPFANIDHHLSNANYAEHNIVDTASSATAEILAGMIFDNKLPVDRFTAQGLYTGILTDTGQFRFNATTRRTFLLAAELFSCGACPAEAGYELYERESLGKLQLLQRFLASLKMEFNGRICIGMLPDGVFEQTGSNAEDTEGLVDYARAIDGVDVGVLIEIRPNAIKASLRAKDPAVRVDRIAGLFNGGGHACAAGLNLKESSIETFYPSLVAAITRQLLAIDAQKSKS